MRDIVETVIDGILQKERMQQHARHQKAQHARMASRNPEQASIQTRFHTPGTAIPTSDKPRDAALWKVSKQFEAIFVQQMMSSMRKTVSKSDFLPSGFAEDVHGSMMDDAIAQASVKHSNFGIADNIYRQLDRAQHSPRKTGSTQEISTSVDKLNTAKDLTLEVKYAN